MRRFKTIARQPKLYLKALAILIGHKILFFKWKNKVYNIFMLKKGQEQTDKIHEFYQKLGISPQNYPPYTDPSSFSRQFKKCTIYEPNDLIYSSSSTRSEHKNNS